MASGVNSAPPGTRLAQRRTRPKHGQAEQVSQQGIRIREAARETVVRDDVERGCGHCHGTGGAGVVAHEGHFAEQLVLAKPAKAAGLPTNLADDLDKPAGHDIGGCAGVTDVEQPLARLNMPDEST